MKTVYTIIFLYRDKLWCKIGHGEETRVDNFKREAPIGVQVLDYYALPVAGSSHKVEQNIHKHYGYEQVPNLLPNTTEVFIVNDLQLLRTRIDREIVNEEARCIKRNKNVSRFIQITPNLVVIDCMVQYAIEQNPRSILVLDDRNGEVKRSLLLHGFPINRIVVVDTRDEVYPDSEVMKKFDFVIMNPPWSKGNKGVYWKLFVDKALSFLTPTGKLIAIIPQNKTCTFQNVLIKDIVFDGVHLPGQAVVLNAGDKISLAKTGVSGKEFIKYGLIVAQDKNELSKLLKYDGIFGLRFDQARPKSTMRVGTTSDKYFSRVILTDCGVDLEPIRQMLCSMQTNKKHTAINNSELLSFVEANYKPISSNAV